MARAPEPFPQALSSSLPLYIHYTLIISIPLLLSVFSLLVFRHFAILG